MGKGTATQAPATTTRQISLWAAAPTGMEEALPHSSGCDSWTSGQAPAPRGYPAGITGPGRPGHFPRLPQPGLSPQCSPPRPAERSPTPLRQCTETGLGPGSWEAFRFQHSLLQAELTVVGTETRALAADLQELEALSTSWQSGRKPRSEGARASVLTTTAVTGWPGM